MSASQANILPLAVYRYFREQIHAEMMLKGSIRLTTLAACRAYEDAERGDPEEGTQTYLSGTITGGSEDADFVERARRSGISIGPGCTDIYIENCTSTDTIPDAYILCASTVRDDAHFSKAFGSYCVHIVAPWVVMRYISSMLFLLGKATEGACMPVVYRDRTYTGLEEMHHPVFVKPAAPYASQREFRFAWTPKGIFEGPLDIIVPSIAPYCRRVA